MAAELRDDADGRDNARLKIIAGLLGVGFEELRRRDLAARNRRLVGIAATSLAVAAVTIVLAIQALRARNEAERSRQQGEELIGFMLGDLRGKLEPLGKLEILDAVGDKAMTYFAGLDDARDPGPRARAARARALRQIGEVRFAQGRPAEAVGTLDAALAIQKALVAEHPGDNTQLFELGQTEYWVGFAAWRAGDFDRAEARFKAYQQVAERLAARDPENVDWQAEVAYAWNNLGVLAFERRRYADALPLFRKSMAVVDDALRGGRLSIAVAADLLNARSWEGLTLMALNRRDEGLSVLGDHAARTRELIARGTGDFRLQQSFCMSLSSYGIAAIEGGQPQLALDIAAEGLRIADALIHRDADNLDSLSARAYHLQVKASAEFQLGEKQQAHYGIDEAISELMTVLERDPKRILLRVSLVSLWDIAWQRDLHIGNLSGARKLVADALTVAEQTPTDRIYAPIIKASAHLMALELAILADQGDETVKSHRGAASAALDLIDEKAVDTGRRASRLQALLGLMSGISHISEAAWPDSAAPWAYSVVSFIERHCLVASAVPDSRLDCRRLLPLAVAARELANAAGLSSASATFNP